MTNEEKIRLVLETLGVDNVRQAAKELRNLKDATEDVGKAASQAAGKSGPNGAGILQLAYLIDDLQYGVRGVMNNIPTLAQSLGLGAGLAGAAGIAAVAIGTLIEKHPEWFNWNEKIKLSLMEVVDAIRAEEEAVKRQKEEIEKLGKTNSDRVEDLIKLKTATEDLKAAEDQLAEDRKNRKAFEEAEKNIGEAQKDEIGRRKGAFKDLISDAGKEKELRDQISNAVAAAMPAVEITDADRQRAMGDVASEAGTNLKNMSPGEIRRRAEKKLVELRQKRSIDRDAEIRKSTENIFGGLANPQNVDESEMALGRLGNFVPDQAQAIRELMASDREAEKFDAGNQRWRQGGGARRRAAERAFAEGERTGAAMLPNRGTLEEADITARAKALAEAEAKEKARREIMASLAGQLPDPETMAAMRRQNAGIGVGAVGRMRMAEQADMNLLFNTFTKSGMGEQDARQMVGEYMQQGNEAFSEFAQANGQNAKNINEGLRAAMQFMQKVQQDQQETAQIVQWMQSMASGEAMQVRPQLGRARN